MLDSRSVQAVFLFFCCCVITLTDAFAAEQISSEYIEKTVSTNGFSYTQAPLPDWVAIPEAVEATSAKSAMYYELIDDEYKIDSDTTIFFRNIVRVVQKSAGLDIASQVKIDFDPSYQSLAFHKLVVVREGQRINRLDDDSIKLLQRETGLEEKLYNGSVTATLDLDDIRLGDKIEYAFSIKGSNPVFESKFSKLYFVPSTKGEIQNYQYRLLAPVERQINFKVGDDFKMEQKVVESQRETLITRQHIPQAKFDERAPAFSYLKHYIQVSEYQSWSEVADWGKALFAYSQYPQVKAQADKISSSTSTIQSQAELAVDFVQSQIRYLGMEMGQNSHLPNQPDKVIDQRYGDCKDKTLLLIALLKELNVNAEPVLVSTYYNNDTNKLLPNPLVFNHVIAAVRLDNQIYYIDGTRQFQKGRLAARESSWFGKGLVLKTGTVGLSDLPFKVGKLDSIVDEVFEIAKFSGSPRLKSDITYYDGAAERLRQISTTVSSEQLNDMFLEQYVQIYPSIERIVPLEIQEIDGENALKVTQTFEVPDYWQYYEEKALVGSAYYWSLLSALPKPTENRRTLPYSINNPVSLKHNVTFSFPEKVMKPSNSTIFKEKNPLFTFEVKDITTEEKTIFESTLSYTAHQVAPDQWKSYAKNSIKTRDKMASYVQVPTMSEARFKTFKSDLKSLDQSLRKFRGEKQALERYTEASVRALFLKAQLSGDRLNETFRAKAFHKLAEYQDDLDQKEAAVTSYEQALKLKPDDPEILASYAVNSFGRGEYEQSKSLIQQARAIDADLNFLMRTLAYDQYFAEEYSVAKQTLTSYMDNASAYDKAYARIWLYLTSLRQSEAVDEVLSQVDGSPEDEDSLWQHAIIKVLAGQTDYDDLEKTLENDKEQYMKLCELYYFLGEQYLIKGNKRKARRFFKKSV